MNEEEITERIKDLIHTCDLGIQQHGTYDDLFELDKTALEGILDLYNKEKEKNKELEEKLKIATAMLTKGTYPEENEGDNDFDKQFISKNKIKEIVDECIEKKANVITGEEEYCFNTNDNSFLAHKIVELLEEK